MSADMSRRSYSTQPQRPPASRPGQPARPAPLTNGQQRQTADEIDASANNLFEVNAAKFIAPTDKIPALLHQSEIPGLRTKFTTGQGRLDYLTQLTSARLDFYYLQRGYDIFAPLTQEQYTDAQQFFAKHGMRLKGDKPQAPPNPIREREQATPPAGPDRAAGATAAPPPAREEPKPAPASLPENKPAPVATDPAALLAELKGLRGDVAGLRQVLELIAAQLAQAPAPAAAAPQTPVPAPEITYELGEGESFRDFWMESVKVGTDDKTGAPTYKAVGHPYTQFGVRIWPEVLPDLALDPATLKPGVNPLPRRSRVRAVIGADGNPRKVVGLAG